MAVGPIMIHVLKPGEDADRILAAIAAATGRETLPEPGNAGFPGHIQLFSGDQENERDAIADVLDEDPANDGWLIVRLPGV